MVMKDGEISYSVLCRFYVCGRLNPSLSDVFDSISFEKIWSVNLETRSFDSDFGNIVFDRNYSGNAILRGRREEVDFAIDFLKESLNEKLLKINGVFLLEKRELNESTRESSFSKKSPLADEIVDLTEVDCRIIGFGFDNILDVPRPEGIPYFDEDTIFNKRRFPAAVLLSDDDEEYLVLTRDNTGKAFVYKMKLQLFFITLEYYRRRAIKLAEMEGRKILTGSAGFLEDYIELFKYCDELFNFSDLTKLHDENSLEAKRQSFVASYENKLFYSGVEFYSRLASGKGNMPLYFKYGVTVKKFDDSAAQQNELDAIHSTLDEVWDYFGTVKYLGFKSRLIILYEAVDQKADILKNAGEYLPVNHAIRINVMKDNDGRMYSPANSLVHGLSLFLDNSLSSDAKKRQSEIEENIEWKIATEFKKCLSDIDNSSSSELTSSEYFARAIEQDYMMKHECNNFSKRDGYLIPVIFCEKICPLVDIYLAELKRKLSRIEASLKKSA